MAQAADRQPPATLVLGVGLVHVLVLRAWLQSPLLQVPVPVVPAQQVIPMRMLPTDTAEVADAPQTAPPPGSRPRVGAPTLRPAAGIGQETPPPAPTQARAAPATEPPPAPATGPLQLPGTPQLPPAARWQYVATQQRRGLLSVGTGVLDWTPSGDQYAVHLAWNIPGQPARSQSSSGTLGPGGLAPRRYGARGRSEFATHLDAANGRVVFSSNRPQLPLADGLQDRASVLLQLAGWLAADPARFRAGAVVRVPTVGSHDAADWDFIVDGTEPLDLPGGRMEAVRLTRAPAGPWELRLEAWFAPGMDYAPVRLRLTPPNGDWLDLQWSGTDAR